MPDCNILAVVTSVDGFGQSVVEKGEIQVGDWVRLTHANVWNAGTSSHRTDIEGTWGRLGRHYRPIINLETGELYA